MLKQHVLLELNQFLQAVTNHRGISKNITAPLLVRTSLHLLEDLPAAREIVFDYFALVFDVCVGSYVTFATNNPKGGIRPESASQQEDDSFIEIQEALENIVNKGPVAWGPLIASWSLDLIGKLSDKYSNKRMSIGASCNFWLNCNSMRGLLSLVSSCFRKLNNSDAESCVEALLGKFRFFENIYKCIS